VTRAGRSSLLDMLRHRASGAETRAAVRLPSLRTRTVPSPMAAAERGIKVCHMFISAPLVRRLLCYLACILNQPQKFAEPGDLGAITQICRPVAMLCQSAL